MHPQKVLVTAGASGVGREIVRGFENNGAKVFVVDVDANGLSTLATETSKLRFVTWPVVRISSALCQMPFAPWADWMCL